MTAPLIIGAAIAIVGILARPFGTSEAWWTCAGALVIVLGGALAPLDALRAVGDGGEVYAFLVGMMVLAGLAQRAGLFDWLADRAVRASRGSASLLFGIVFGVGVVVTTFLSNDATAVVLTPAVLAVVQRAKLDALPFAYACAFVANAASFVLPISNPANLVVFGNRLPPIVDWFAHFGIPSAIAVIATYAALRVVFRRELRRRYSPVVAATALSPLGRFVAVAIGLCACAIVAVGFAGRNVGLATLVSATLALVAAGARERALFGALRRIDWAIVPMVAGLFTIVGAIEHAGVLAPLHTRLSSLHATPGAAIAVAGVMTIACNLVNNLPVGLIAASLVPGAASTIRDVVVVAVDLGPNLSITGSLATVLWLAALRRAGIATGFVQFLTIGAVVTVPALVLCAFASVATSR